eukprot:gb/GECG01015680.1/.p1 GENE.gb/GECG01015680.1/~~gb/GECG01015680.1/.p1  ORF type:complete len:375 (+),score=41.19 gb/GECG01015680.1/:1-1125(+)
MSSSRTSSSTPRGKRRATKQPVEDEVPSTRKTPTPKSKRTKRADPVDEVNSTPAAEVEVSSPATSSSASSPKTSRPKAAYALSAENFAECEKRAGEIFQNVVVEPTTYNPTLVGVPDPVASYTGIFGPKLSPGLFIPEKFSKMRGEELRELARNLGLHTPVKAGKTEVLRTLSSRQGIMIALLGGRKTGTLKYVSNKLDLDATKCSYCFLKGVMNGLINIDVEDPMNEVVHRGKCAICSKDGLVARVKDVIHQPDYAGTDYECGGIDGSVRCEDCKIGLYLEGMCERSRLNFGSGKGHNHCTRCRNFGKCIGDYREVHCTNCGNHFWGGFVIVCKCDKCGKPRDQDEDEKELRKWFRDMGEPGFEDDSDPDDYY